MEYSFIAITLRFTMTQSDRGSSYSLMVEVQDFDLEVSQFEHQLP